MVERHSGQELVGMGAGKARKYRSYARMDSSGLGRTVQPFENHGMTLSVLSPMLRSIILSAAILIAPLLFGQTPLEHDWARRVGSLNDGEKLWRMAVDEDGNVFVTGSLRGTFTDQGVSVTSVGGSDIVLLKYSPTGELLWGRAAGGPLNDAAFGIDTDKDGNVYITGAYSGLAVFGDTVVANIDPDGVNLPFSFVARYAADGELDWVRTADVDFLPSNYPFSISYAVRVNSAGDLIICGTYSCTLASDTDPEISTMSFGGAGFRTCGLAYEYTYVQRMDTLGNTEWVHSIGGTQGLGTFLSLAFDAQGDIWVGGNVFANSGTPYIDGPVDLGLSATTTVTGVVMQLSGDGDPLSGFLLNNTDVSNVEDILVAGNGDVYVSGWHRGSLYGSPAASGIDGFLMRLTSSGAPVWSRRLAGLSDDFFSGITTTTEPNELVGGAFYFFNADLPGADLATSTGTTSALVRLDTMGTVIEVVQPQVLSGYSLIADVQSDLFGNFYLCGDMGGLVRFGPDTLESLSQDMYVTKLSPQVTTALADGYWKDALVGTVYPNPTTGPLTISGTWGSPQLDLFDVQGSVVRSFAALGPDRRVDLSGLEPGVYVLTDGQGKVARIVLETDR